MMKFSHIICFDPYPNIRPQPKKHKQVKESARIYYYLVPNSQCSLRENRNFRKILDLKIKHLKKTFD
jgi:hypothetical protein